MGYFDGSSPGGAYRTLWEWEKADYADHLIRLDAASRRRRFHQVMSDVNLARHADRVFASPNVHVIGWFKDGVLRGAVELALFETKRGREAEAAFAIEHEYRRQGVGRGLMQRAVLHARNQGAVDLHIATDRDNKAMIGLAQSCGCSFHVEDTDADGVVRAEPRTVVSLALETLEEEVGVVQWAWDSATAWFGRLLRRARHEAL